MGPREEQKSSIQAVVTYNPYHPGGENRAYPKEWGRRFLLPDGTHIFVRPVRPDDDELFRDFAKGVSEEDARLRFFGPKKELSDADLDRLVHIDYGRAMAFVAIEESSGKMVGVVGCTRSPIANRVNSRSLCALTLKVTDWVGCLCS